MKTSNVKTSIASSTKAYEDWLRRQLDTEIIENDLSTKHDKMREDPFQFLRATYWRWAETILIICPDLANAPTVLAIGDIHLENFGTWRDVDGRLVWGVNDFDEAAEMPYVLDLLRLATSAVLARPKDAVASGDLCAAIIDGYGKGLSDPRPFVLDEKHGWLRAHLVATEDDRAHFWKKIDALQENPNGPSERFRNALKGAMPDPAMALAFRPRTAGTGSLGRPRWVGIGDWRGGRVVREAKALVASGWTLVAGRGSPALRGSDIIAGAYRAPDPWYRTSDNIVVRRLSPNSHKIEIEGDSSTLFDTKMLQQMGHELANIHLGTGNRRTSIKKDFDGRKGGALHNAALAAAEFVSNEFEEWKKG
jgi:hypothetical protein